MQFHIFNYTHVKIYLLYLWYNKQQRQLGLKEVFSFFEKVIAFTGVFCWYYKIGEENSVKE